MDQTLKRAKEVTRRGPYPYLEYARFANDFDGVQEGAADKAAIQLVKVQRLPLSGRSWL